MNEQLSCFAIAFAFCLAVFLFVGWTIVRQRKEKYRSLGFHTTPKFITFFGARGSVNVPLKVAAVTDWNEVVRSGGWINLRSATLHRVNTKFGSHKVPGHPVKVSWHLPDDPAAIMRFHATVPHHRVPFDEKRLYMDKGLFPRPYFYDFNDTNQAEFLLAKIAPLFAGLPPETTPDFNPLFQEYGIAVHVDEWIPAPPPPPPPPKGMKVGMIKYANKVLVIQDELRDKTLYVLGQQGMGKTTLMANMIRQDIEAGKGVGVIDPTGGLAKEVLSYVPPERITDCIYIDPVTSPIGINFFSGRDEMERDLIADNVKTVFQRLTSSNEGDRMDAILSRSLQLLSQTPGATFLDIYRLLTDDEWRKTIARRASDERLTQFWLDTYPKFPHPSAEQPIISRLQKFDSSRALRTITGTISSLNFYDAIRQQKIVICSLAKALLGSNTADILGALLVSQFELAAVRQGQLPRQERRFFHLYVDEFQTFTTSSFNTIITEARQYGLCLTLANQKLSDLDEKARSAVLGANVRFYFRPQDDDARKLGSTVGSYTVDDLMNLDEFDCIVRPGKPSESVKITINQPPRHIYDHVDAIIAHTQATYTSTPPDPPAPIGPVDDDEPGPSSPPPA